MAKVLIKLGRNNPKSNQKITERVKTFEDACDVLGIDQSSIIEISTTAKEIEGDLKSIEAYCKLIIIVRALNEGWKPNWKDSNEYKYYPYFMQGSVSGVGLSYRGYAPWSTATAVGSRLSYRTRELAEYAGKQFNQFIWIF